MIIESSLQSKTIGGILKDERMKKGIKLEDVAKDTKIKLKYLKCLEAGEYSAFDSEVFIKGFLRNYAKYLGLDPDRILALYRREFSPKKEGKRNLPSGKYITQLESRKAIILLCSVVFSLIFVLYLFNQVSYVARPPILEIQEPIVAQSSDNSSANDYQLSTTLDRIEITGKTSENSLVVINGTVIATDSFNNFKSDVIPLPNRENRIKITSTNQFGRESTILLTVSRIIPDENVESIKASITAVYDTTIQVFRDSQPAIDRSIKKDETFTAEAIDELIIIVTDNESVDVKINDNTYKLESGRNIWTLSQGIVTFDTDND